MALALLELTETAAGEVLGQLMATSPAVAAAHPHGVLPGVLSRVRVFAHIGSELTGVPRSVHLQLSHVALASLGHLAKLRGARRVLSAPYMALWHQGQLQELQCHSLAEGLDVWQRQADADDDYVLIEISYPVPHDEDYTGYSLEKLCARLRDGLAESLMPLGRAAPRVPATPAAVIDAVPSEQQIVRDAANHREALAAQWLSAAQVSAGLGSQAANGSHRASHLRRAGQLLGVYVSHPSPSYRYPTWQFRHDGHPVSHLAEILAVLRDFGPFEREPGGARRTSGWGEVEWFLSPHALLDGATPAEALATVPRSVLQAARTEFEDET